LASDNKAGYPSAKGSNNELDTPLAIIDTACFLNSQNVLMASANGVSVSLRNLSINSTKFPYDILYAVLEAFPRE
jgi:hypothetical protein